MATGASGFLWQRGLVGVWGAGSMNQPTRSQEWGLWSVQQREGWGPSRWQAAVGRAGMWLFSLQRDRVDAKAPCWSERACRGTCRRVGLWEKEADQGSRRCGPRHVSEMLVIPGLLPCAWGRATGMPACCRLHAPPVVTSHGSREPSGSHIPGGDHTCLLGSPQPPVPTSGVKE